MPITRTPRSYSQRVPSAVTPGTAGDVVGLLVEGVAAGVHEHDVALRELTRHPLLEVGGRERLAVRAVGGVDHDARGEEPVERELVDGLRAARPSIVEL